MTNKCTKYTIFLATGGTGGHVFPAVSIAEELTRRGYKCRFITDNRGLTYLPNQYRSSATTFYAKTSPRFILYIILMWNILRFMLKFLFLSKKYNMVIGFGGYPSLPPVMAAQILKVKTIIHEQNTVIGKANSILAHNAKKIILSFDGMHCRQKQHVYIGNPTRFENEYRRYNPQINNNDCVTILIIGGSQGAKIFSTVAVQAICKIAETTKIYVYHQVLHEDTESVISTYKKAGINHTVAPFFDDICDLYKKSDLVISRSGASSIFEIIGFAKPSILIPFLQSINGDQMHNAMYLHNRSAAYVYYEDRMDVNDMVHMIFDIIKSNTRILEIQKNLESIRINNITDKICNEIDNVLRYSV